MIRTFADAMKLASAKSPKKMAVMQPADNEVMEAVKKSYHKGHTIPVLIGDTEQFRKVADSAGFNIDPLEKKHIRDPQEIAFYSAGLILSGEADLQMKGQIPTSYVYRAIISRERKTSAAGRFSVVTLWELKGHDKLIAVTDTGINILPGLEDKKAILKNAAYLMRLLNYQNPRALILAGGGEKNEITPSGKDAELIRQAAADGEIKGCLVEKGYSLGSIFAQSINEDSAYDIAKLPDIVLVPNLDCGNILAKLDYLLKTLKRISLVMGSRSPVLIPSRSDKSESIVGEIALGVVLSDRMKSERLDND